MPYANDHKQRLEAALKLLNSDTASLDRIESIAVLLKDLNPRLNKLLDDAHKLLSDIKKLQKGDIIELSVEHFSEHEENDKKRKKLILLFIRTLKDLKSEVNRLQTELIHNKPHTINYGRVIAFAKGPFGLVTLMALIILGVFVLTSKKQSVQKESVVTNKIQVIEFKGKQIPLSELFIGHGPDCGNGVSSPHYHAKNEITAKALDGTVISDPGGCGFGKVQDIRILEIRSARN